MHKRDLFPKIISHLPKKQITLIVGSRQVGKTTLMRQVMDSVQSRGENAIFITLEKPDILASLNAHPENLFTVIPPLPDGQKTFLFIDEIQYLDNPSNFLKLLYDLYADRLKLIVSGSSSFYIDRKFKDSLAGRKRVFRMRPMSFNEFLRFHEHGELTAIIKQGKPVSLVHTKEIDRFLGEYLVYGGYPEVVLEGDHEEKKLLLAELANSYVRKDAFESRLSAPDAYLLLLKVLAGQVGQLMNANELGRDFGMNRLTVKNYLHVMQKSFHITLLRPFYANKAKELKKMPKVFFNDLGLRNFFVNDFSPLPMRADKGELLENAVYCFLIQHFSDEDIRFWRTQDKHEVDFIIAGRFALEVKYSGHQYREK